jgi:hypothetical protein
MSRPTGRNLVIAAFFALTAGLTAKELPDLTSLPKGFNLELRGGFAGLDTRMKNGDTHFLFPAGSVDVIGTWSAKFLESRFRFNLTLADTNTIYFRNGTETNSPYTNKILRARNYSISFREGWPFRFLNNRFHIVPSVELKIAHYTDLSAASEFVDRTTDWMFSFLNLGLELRWEDEWYALRCSYHYPLFGVLTDNWLKENRNEDEFEISGRLKYKNGWLALGFDAFTLRYSQDTRNGDGIAYDTKNHSMGFIAIGYSFK